jgi:hypothetical protein
MKIGLIELPTSKLVDEEGKNWTAVFRREPLVSKQILTPQLQAGGFDAQIVNLKAGNEEHEYGAPVSWKGKKLTKIMEGMHYSTLDPEAYDAWAVTCNFMQQRQIAAGVIRHLASGGKPVVVGGSDAVALPQTYLEAGATAVVQDKSGAANWATFDYVLGQTPREKLTGVTFADGSQYPRSFPPLKPEDWPLPSVDIAKQCLGTEYLEVDFPDSKLPVGSVFADLGCDRHCDFCQTPTYKLGYHKMTPQRVRQWLEIQKEAGARSVFLPSDQFLARLLFKEGRQEVIEITETIRELELSVFWGLEVKKLTRGGAYGGDKKDTTPDEELIEALYGYDGKIGCHHAYIPAERPIFGTKNYAKLLAWKEHRRAVSQVVKAGVAHMSYGVIIGFPDDNPEVLLQLENALWELYEEVSAINPNLNFNVLPFNIAPLPGTPQSDNLSKLGLMRFQDPTIIGGFWTACADTHHMSYEEVSDWQLRLANVGSKGFLERKLNRRLPA